MTEPLTLYGDPGSGNCLKVKWVADRLGIPSIWRTIDVPGGGTRDPAFLALNPAGRVPLVVFPDGETLSESNAIIVYLAEGSALVPEAARDRARMLQWMFWEQYSHEPYIAVRRYQLHYLKRAPDALDPKLAERGTDALRLMQATLERAAFMAGDALTLADVALVAYTRMAHEGGFDLAAYPAIRAWIPRVEAGLGIGPYAGPA
ncbi:MULTISPECIES: glutathione S-transferase family protein [unclassified Methylobacterium]|uniref:glutathione S-transferase family protein n=1 Tax=unclassified Methylobacterium TaxID=2615210 RepID=UPI0011C1FE77|nr:MULTISPECIES: glutathione S-transferase family protein [unclassified Methylobacterium]QEE42181.1 glutathione S-transferase family protein [Methylobacterium sp. WL1]TXN57613.1 glutathione S-transferase family protein [Methylobacterium sp. WL2]